jgi:hypothetical protein
VDLGLNALTDDQLLSLLQEVLGEFIQRDEYLRSLAQNVIDGVARDAKVAEEILAESLDQALDEYRTKLKTEVMEHLRAGLQDGSVRLLTAQQEADLLFESSLENKIKLIDEAVAALRSGMIERFGLLATESAFTVSFAGRRFSVTHRLTEHQLLAAGDYLRRLVLET